MLDRIICLNDPVNLIDPYGLAWGAAQAATAPIALAISQLDTALPGPADLIAGAAMGVAWLIDNFPDTLNYLAVDGNKGC